MRNNLALYTAALMLSATALPAAENLLTPAQDSGNPPNRFIESVESKWKKQWIVSLAPLAASQSLDTVSSFGRRELNPLLASPNGGFGMKAAGIKFGVTGVLAGVEYILVKKYPRSAKFFTIVNWTAAGATSALAVHNFQLPRN